MKNICPQPTSARRLARAQRPRGASYPRCLTGQASLELLCAFLVLIFILFILALATHSLYLTFARSIAQSSDEQSLAAASLDLGLLSSAGSGLRTSIQPAPFAGHDQQLLIPSSNASAATTASTGLQYSNHSAQISYETAHVLPY